jgi:hypothetical protein
MPKVEEKIKIALWTEKEKCVTIYMNTNDNGAFVPRNRRYYKEAGCV